MDYSISDSLQERLNTTQEFLTSEIIPMEKYFLTGQWQELESMIANARLKVKSLGLWAPHLPKSLGGTFTGLVDLALFAEVLGQSPLGHITFGCQAPDAGNAELLHLHGTDEQVEQWLKPLAAGDIRSCFAMTEPHTAGSNPTLLDTTAVLDGDEWVINGRKWFTSSADGADFTIAMVITDEQAHKHSKASMIIVPLDNPGYKLIRNIPVMGHAGQGPFSHAEIEFTDCRVPASYILGSKGQGFALAQERLGPGRIQHCMRWLGIGNRAFSEMCRYVKTRKISSTQTLADQQLMQAMIADSAAELAAARSLVLETAWTVENQGFKAAKEKISLIKFFTANIMQKVVDRSLQAHGALGMTDDLIISYFYREERAARIYDGPDEVHRLSVARKILKDY
ncbi:MAG: acyl-CoA dehydrogenase [Enterobacterales bacterium]|jgi:acyl-CoA dehydrogenase